MEILKVENLTKTYGKGNTLVKALDHVSFSVEKGEFVAIIGASGSGKSTLLHLLGGVDKPTSGRVIVDGEDVYRLNEENLAVIGAFELYLDFINIFLDLLNLFGNSKD